MLSKADSLCYRRELALIYIRANHTQTVAMMLLATEAVDETNRAATSSGRRSLEMKQTYVYKRTLEPPHTRPHA